MQNTLRPIAIHLPQFHPIPENDEWWGKGFTEWTNVVKAKPLFSGHYQPHEPTGLGYYDLREAAVRFEQARLAKEHGIFGFCYYHYWFNGRRILEKPVEAILKSGQPDFPFMLCWANENWTRKWDGGDSTVLLQQNYSADDAYEHILALLPMFRDKRYIRVNNKPVFAFYRTGLISNLEEYVRIFRAEAAKENMELYLCRFYNSGDYSIWPFLDASIEFQPFTQSLDNYWKHIGNKPANFIKRLQVKLLKKTGFVNRAEKKYTDIYKRLAYNDYVDYVMANYTFNPAIKLYPGVMPSWDNTARRGEEAFLFTKANPEKFRSWLEFYKDNFRPYSEEENFIFINAWNEWAEGTHLEPDVKWGDGNLQAVKHVFGVDKPS